MNINRSSFTTTSIVEEIRAAIINADYVAIDTEMSGLNVEEARNNLFDSIDDRYCAAATSASVFQMMQLGVCTIKQLADGSFECAPFNFTLYPSEFAKNDKVFGVSASAFTFLSQNGFDFNKWVREGVPYLSIEQEKKLRAKGYGKTPASSSTTTTTTNEQQPNEDASTPATKEAKKDDRQPVVLDAASEKYVSDELQKIDAFFAANSSDDAVYKCAPTNGFKRLLLHQGIFTRLFLFAQEQQLLSIDCDHRVWNHRALDQLA